MISEFFLTQENSAVVTVGYSYNVLLVALSFAVAIFASFTAFHLIERIAEAQDRAQRMKWLTIGAVIMGFGVWSMHFVAMVAVVMDYQVGASVRYNVPLTVLSAVFAMLASGVAFAFVGRGARTLGKVLLVGTILGAGIGAMHYTGMFAMRMGTEIRYDPVWFGASIVVAVVLASFATQLLFWITESRDRVDIAMFRIATAAAMGCAIALMHYTGMAATHFLAFEGTTAGAMDGIALEGTMTGVSLAAAAFIVLILTWLLTMAGGRDKAEEVALERSEPAL